ncbi:DVL [Parasponia andersonii]|uniref:DVL n=1 Tax=Parasponia andersonii TaxID=3476 RepID=A0A2P5AI59_PARAD|nr:DVL [Parasponia andersonii]
MAEIQLQKRSFTNTKRKGNGFSRKCAILVKEQRARIYVLCRCATMLLCWNVVVVDCYRRSTCIVFISKRS